MKRMGKALVRPACRNQGDFIRIETRRSGKTPRFAPHDFFQSRRLQIDDANLSDHFFLHPERNAGLIYFRGGHSDAHSADNPRLRRANAAVDDTGIFRPELNGIRDAILAWLQFHHHALPWLYFSGLPKRTHLVPCVRDARGFAIRRDFDERLASPGNKGTQNYSKCNPCFHFLTPLLYDIYSRHHLTMMASPGGCFTVI